MQVPERWPLWISLGAFLRDNVRQTIRRKDLNPMKTSRRAALLASLLACLGPALAAPVGAPHLLLDVNSGPPAGIDRHAGYPPPTRFATVQGRAVFFADLDDGNGLYGPAPGP